MAATSAYQGRNRLLRMISNKDFALLKPSLEAIDLPFRHVLEVPDQDIEHAYFLEAGMASVVGTGNHVVGSVEIGLIGREGVSGLPVVMGNHRSPHETFMQVAGHGTRIAAAALQRSMAARPSIHAVLLRFAQAFAIQVSHTAIANSRGTIVQRLARWLLMAHDRAEGDAFRLTHELISTMLGVRRAGVTVAISELETQGLIRAEHARIVVVDRRGLEALAGIFYGVPEAELERLLG